MFDVSFLTENVWWITGASVLMMVLILILTGWALIRIPEDYFQKERPHLFERIRVSSPMKIVFLLLKNLFALLFLVTGFLLLVLPGQGLLSILVGLLLMDFPRKKRFERMIVERPAIRRTINALRNTFHQPELEL